MAMIIEHEMSTSLASAGSRFLKVTKCIALSVSAGAGKEHQMPGIGDSVHGPPVHGPPVSRQELAQEHEARIGPSV